jgi:hypothetical protein
MTTVTMEEIIQRNQLDKKLLHDPQFTRRVAAELRSRGFKSVTYKSANGKRSRIWSDKSETITKIEVKTLVDLALGGPKQP